MVPFVLIKEPGYQTRSGPQKLGKHVSTLITMYMVTPDKKQIDTYPKWKDKCIFQGIFRGLIQW